jgi:hypothetical protein
VALVCTLPMRARTCAHIHTQNTHTRQGVAGVIGALDALRDGGVVSVNLTEPAHERPRGPFLLLLVRVCVCARAHTLTHVDGSLDNTRVAHVCTFGGAGF